MRVGLDGFIQPHLPVLLNLANGSVFQPLLYSAQGYTNFEVLVVGAAGGRGCRAISLISNTTNRYISYGGEGGGGGTHLKRGLLSDLPTYVPVVVGVAGADAADIQYESTEAGNGTGPKGGDGGYSSFNGTFAIASGGVGGQPGRSDIQQSPGGAGGIGGQQTAGGGGAGAPEKTTAAVRGGWNGQVGGGGGGGSGGHGRVFYNTGTQAYELSVQHVSTQGAEGNYPPDNIDTRFTSNFGYTTNYTDPVMGGVLTDLIPGGGGGCNPYPVNNVQGYQYGTNNPFTHTPQGVVFLRVYRED